MSGSLAAAILPSRLVADFSVTSGVPCRMYLAKLSFSFLASASHKPTSTLTPASRSFAKPCPATFGFRILHRANHAADSRRDDGVDTRSGLRP